MPNTLNVLYSAFSCLTVALAASVPQTTYDALIVGGGPAGLSALSSLSRVRRTAVMFDSGEYRNAPTREMHDVIGNDGTPPAAFRAAAREQISQYPVAHMVNTTITSIVPMNGTNGTTAFVATDKDGNKYTGRKVVLGTGMKDILPNTPGMEGAWGKGVYWCPWCDGWEHRDEPFGLLCPLNKVVPNVREIYTLNSDIIAFVNGTQTEDAEKALDSSDPNWRTELSAYNVTVDNRTIASIERLQDGGDHRDDEGRQYDIFRLHFTDNSTIERNAFLASFGAEQRSSLPTKMGVELTTDGSNKIKTDIGQMTTNVNGVYAIGDANSDGSTNVPHAMFSAKRAVVYIHGALGREDMAAAISKRSPVPEQLSEAEIEKRMGTELEDLWEQVRHR